LKGDEYKLINKKLLEKSDIQDYINEAYTHLITNLHDDRMELSNFIEKNGIDLTYDVQREERKEEGKEKLDT